MNQTNPTSYSLEYISKLRAEKLKEIQKSKTHIRQLTQELFAPQESKNKVDNLLRHVNAGMAAYDGLMTGLKVFHRIRGIFRKK